MTFETFPLSSVYFLVKEDKANEWLISIRESGGGSFDGMQSSYEGYTTSIPYFTVVTPLTLLSAWLLLSKPRARTPTPENPAAPRI